LKTYIHVAHPAGKYRVFDTLFAESQGTSAMFFAFKIGLDAHDGLLSALLDDCVFRRTN
jgi:hypothetical protein